MAKEKAVVVGAGGISNAWFKPLQAEGISVAGIVDLNLDRAKAQAAKYGFDAMLSTDLAATLKATRPDFVVDLTVPEAHSTVTCTALGMGCHVIGEKPMADSMEAARKMVKASEDSGKLYMVSQSRRWNAQHDRVRRTIESGALGTLNTLNCDFFMGCHFGGFRDEMPSPLILDMSIHHFDMARMFCGADAVAVYAYEYNPPGSWYKGDVAASCIFEMTSGIVFNYRGSWCAEGCHTSWNGDWRIIGQNGTLIYDHDKDPAGELVAGDTGFKRPTKELTVPASEMEFGGQHGALREMLEFLRTGRRPQCECHDNIKSLAMVFGAIESARKRTRVQIA